MCEFFCTQAINQIDQSNQQEEITDEMLCGMLQSQYSKHKSMVIYHYRKIVILYIVSHYEASCP